MVFLDIYSFQHSKRLKTFCGATREEAEYLAIQAGYPNTKYIWEYQ